MKSQNANMTSFRLMIVLVLSIFLGEMAIMFFLAKLPPLSMRAVAILDGLLITTLSFPFLYYLSFRPLILHISKREKAQEELRKAHDGLELRVQAESTSFCRYAFRKHAVLPAKRRLSLDKSATVL